MTAAHPRHGAFNARPLATGQALRRYGHFDGDAAAGRAEMSGRLVALATPQDSIYIT